MPREELKAYLSGAYGDGMAWISDSRTQGQVDGLEKDLGNKICGTWQWLDVGSKEKVDTKKDPGVSWWLVAMFTETQGRLVVGMVRRGGERLGSMVRQVHLGVSVRKSPSRTDAEQILDMWFERLLMVTGADVKFLICFNAVFSE